MYVSNLNTHFRRTEYIYLLYSVPCPLASKVNKGMLHACAQAGEEVDDEIFYTDKRGGRDHECLSLGCDHEPVLAGRTPLQTYADFVGEFSNQCKKYDLWGARPSPQ